MHSQRASGQRDHGMAQGGSSLCAGGMRARVDVFIVCMEYTVAG
jgi:hypothetical protein